MKKGQKASAARVKERRKEGEILKNDLHLKKEAGKLGVILLYLLGVVVGGLSLSALVSGLLHMMK